MKYIYIPIQKYEVTVSESNDYEEVYGSFHKVVSDIINFKPEKNKEKVDEEEECDVGECDVGLRGEAGTMYYPATFKSVTDNILSFTLNQVSIYSINHTFPELTFWRIPWIGLRIPKKWTP